MSQEPLKPIAPQHPPEADEAVRSDQSAADASARETPADGSFLGTGTDTPPQGHRPAAPPGPEAGLPFSRLGHYQILGRIGGGGSRCRCGRRRRTCPNAVAASVRLSPEDVFGRLPYLLSSPPSAGEEPARAPRRMPLVLPEPHVVEVHYRILPPPGFALKPLPESKAFQVGPAR